MGQLCKNRIAYFLSGVLVVCLSILQPVAGEARQPTPEMCTCTVSESDRTGANIANAGVCLADVHTPVWCEISVVALINSPRHQELVSEISGALPAGDSTQIHALIVEIIETHMAALRGSSEIDRFAQDAEQILSLLSDVVPVLEDCGSAFRAYEDGFFEGYELEWEGFVSCRVDGLSGWLEIAFRIEDHLYRFLFAPIES